MRNFFLPCVNALLVMVPPLSDLLLKYSLSLFCTDFTLLFKISKTYSLKVILRFLVKDLIPILYLIIVNGLSNFSIISLLIFLPL